MIIIVCIPNYRLLEGIRDKHQRKLPWVKALKLNLRFHLQNCLRTFLLCTKCQALFNLRLFTNVMLVTTRILRTPQREK